MCAAILTFPGKPAKGLKPETAPDWASALIPPAPGALVASDSYRIYAGNMLQALIASNTPWYNSAKLFTSGGWDFFKMFYGSRLRAHTMYRYFVPSHQAGALPFETASEKSSVSYYFESNTLHRQDIVCLDGKPLLCLVWRGYDSMGSDEPDWSETPSNVESLQEPLMVRAIPLDVARVEEMVNKVQLAQFPNRKHLPCSFKGHALPTSLKELLPHDTPFYVLGDSLAAVRSPETLLNFEHFARRHFAFAAMDEWTALPIRGFLGWSPLTSPDGSSQITALVATELGILQLPPQSILYSLAGQPSFTTLRLATQRVFRPDAWCVEHPGEPQAKLMPDNSYAHLVKVVAHQQGSALPETREYAFQTHEAAQRFSKRFRDSQPGPLPREESDLPGHQILWNSDPFDMLTAV